MTTRLRFPVLGLVLVVMLAACRGLGPAPTDAPIDHPSGDALVFRYGYSGGFVPVETVFTNLPAFTLLGDGRVIVQGPQIEIYPGPALPAVQVRTLTEAGIQALLAEILDSGQFAASAQWLGAQSRVADAATTDFALHADGRDLAVGVYALGMLDSPGDMTDAERTAHAALGGVVQRLSMLDSWLPAGDWVEPDWQPYVADAFRLLVRDADGVDPAPGDLPRGELPWPTTSDPATFGTPRGPGDGARCGVVEGSQAAAWYAALASANQLTSWTFDGHAYAVAVRPLLPDEAHTCA